MFSRRTVLCLGTSQLVSWGISFYLIGAFGELIVADLGWSRALVHGGFSTSLLVMGVVSPLVGRLIDRFGGGRVMAAGSILCAIGCASLAFARTVPEYYAAWICLGFAMRATLYDAAFAALARIAGPEARRPISQITLLGGFASTVFWPIGSGLAEVLGWRGALLAYAGFAVLTIPLHLAIPSGRYKDISTPEAPARPTALPMNRGPGRLAPAAYLYALIFAITNALSSAMSAHMIGMLIGLGLSATLAVSISTLRGIGQVSARLVEVLFGGRIHPFNLNLAATTILFACFMAGFGGGSFVVAAAAFAFFYGAGNGIMTITRGTLPLVLFEHSTYGALVGKLLAPSFILSAASPFAYALVIESFGTEGAFVMSLALALVALAAAVALKMRRGRDIPPSRG